MRKNAGAPDQVDHHDWHCLLKGGRAYAQHTGQHPIILINHHNPHNPPLHHHHHHHHHHSHYNVQVCLCVERLVEGGGEVGGVLSTLTSLALEVKHPSS